MSKKQRYIDTIIRNEERHDEKNSYRYELLMSRGSDVASFRIPLYSIKVSMTDSEGNDTSAEVSDVFADAGKAILFYEKIVRNLATPIDLAYILEDEIR